MNVFDMTKKDFEKVPERGGFSEDIGEFNSLVIIPMGYAHDSGWMCMDFVAVSEDGEPICRLSGNSDVLHVDGIGGYGNWHGGELPRRIKPKYKQEVECADGDCFIKCLHSEEVQYCPCKNDDYCSFGERRDSND